MKLKHIFIFSLLGILLITLSCKKKLFDYRNKYIGEWSFIIERSSFNMGDSTNTYEKISYNGGIKYGESDEEITIQYTNDNSITLKVDENGMIYDFPSKYCSGTIGKDNIDLYLRWGGLGGGTIHSVTGSQK